jgi:hypothetical protein
VSRKQLNHLDKTSPSVHRVAMVSRIFVYIICLVSSLLWKNKKANWDFVCRFYFERERMMDVGESLPPPHSLTAAAAYT